MTTVEEPLYQTAAHAIEQIATIGLCLHVLAPTRLAFAVDIALLQKSLPDQADDRLAHLHLATLLNARRAANKPVVAVLDARLRGASTVLGADLVLWVLALTVT